MCISDDRFGIKELCLSYSLLDVNYDIFGLLAEIGIAAQKYGIRELTRLVDKSIMELLPKNDCTDWIDEPMSECSDEMDHNLECLVQYAFCEGSDNSELQNHLSQPIVAFFLRKPASYSDTVVETWKEFLKKNPQVLLKLFESVVNSESVRDRKSPIPSKPSSTCNNCGGSADPKSHNDLECHLERLNSRTTEGVLTGSAQDDPELTREKKELSGALKKLDAATHREAFRIICKAVPVLRVSYFLAFGCLPNFTPKQEQDLLPYFVLTLAKC